MSFLIEEIKKRKVANTFLFRYALIMAEYSIEEIREALNFAHGKGELSPALSEKMKIESEKEAKEKKLYQDWFCSLTPKEQEEERKRKQEEFIQSSLHFLMDTSFGGP